MKTAMIVFAAHVKNVQFYSLEGFSAKIQIRYPKTPLKKIFQERCPDRTLK